MAELTSQQAENLTKMYTQAEADILRELNKGLLEGNDLKYLQGMQRNVQSILSSLNRGSKKWCEDAIPSIYTSGKRIAEKQLKEVGFSLVAGFGAIHQQAAQVLADATYGRFQDTNLIVGRRVNDIYRNLALENARSSVIGYSTIDKVAEDYKKALAEKGITGFVDKAGHNWNMSSYADMVAQTTTHSAFIEGTSNRLLENDLDLVIVSKHPGACSQCLPWEGKILSLSGNTEGYPTLAEAKEAGLFHPRCGHAITAHVDLDAEIAELQKQEAQGMSKDAIKAAKVTGLNSMEITSTMKKYLEQTLLEGKPLEEIAQHVSKSGFEEVRRVHNRIQKNPVWATMKTSYDEQWTKGSVFTKQDLNSLFDLLNNKGIGEHFPNNLSYAFMTQEYAQIGGDSSVYMDNLVRWMNKKNIELDEEELLLLLRRVERTYPDILEVAHTNQLTVVTMLQQAKEADAVAEVIEDVVLRLAPPSIDEKEILKASTFKDLLTTMKKSAGFKNVAVDKVVGTMDVQALKESLAGVHKVIDRFPALRNTLKNITVVKGDTGNIMSCGFSGVGATLNFCEDVYKTYASAVENCINVTKLGKQTSKFHPRMKDLSGVPIHEMGHVIEAHLIMQVPGIGVLERSQMWSKGKIPQDIVRKAVAAVKKTDAGYWSPGGTPLTTAELRGQISDYATYTTGETIAEAMADWFENGENSAPLSKAIMQEIERRMS